MRVDEKKEGENEKCTRRERQRWRSIKYKYFVTALMYIFQVSALDYFFLSLLTTCYCVYLSGGRSGPSRPFLLE